MAVSFDCLFFVTVLQIWGRFFGEHIHTAATRAELSSCAPGHPHVLGSSLHCFRSWQFLRNSLRNAVLMLEREEEAVRPVMRLYTLVFASGHTPRMVDLWTPGEYSAKAEMVILLT